MSGDGRWTVETVLSHLTLIIEERFQRLESLVDGNDRRYQERFTNAEDAVKEAKQAIERRFEGVNEFRATLADQQRTLMPRSEAEVKFNSLAARIDILEKGEREQSGTGSGITKGWGAAVGVGGLVLLVLGIIGAVVALIVGRQ